MALSVLLACALAGFVAGSLLWVQVLRWIGLIHITARKHEGDFLAGARRRLAWFTPFVTLLHPAPWLMLALGYFFVRALRTNSSEGWSWFLVATAAGVTAQASLTLITLLRLRRSRNQLR